MTIDPTPQPARGSLQFESAEFTGEHGPMQCAYCSAKITDRYYHVDGKTACAQCRAAAEKGVPRAGLGSTSAGRFGRAILFGLGAAIGGSVLWYTITAVTGYQLGIIAVAVGYLVGTAVKKGSMGRGGWRYQTLAIALTYLSIVSSYIPVIVREFRAKAGVEALADSAGAARRDSSGALPAADSAAPAPVAVAGDTSAAAAAAAAAATAQPADSGAAVPDSAAPAASPAAPDSSAAGARAPAPLSAGKAILGVLALLALAAVLPFLAGVRNIIGILIIGFALFEAFKINKRIPVTITGPFRVGTPPPPHA
jgi:hypothetical protein